jgi:outer membrane biosynthesis protein TonB
MPLVPCRSILILLCSIVLLFSDSLSGQQSPAPQDNPPAEQTQKPEQTEPPAQTQPPSAEPTQPSSEPGAQTELPASTPPPTSTAPAATKQQRTETQKPVSTKTHKAKHPRRKTPPTKRKPAPDSSCGLNDGKVVVRNGGARDSSSQLTPGMTQEQQLHSRENTAQLLATTDSNLKTIAGRQLTDSQHSMLDQIHAYVRQSKAAVDAGDLPRAHTLAYKAHLLSDELAHK